MPGVKVPPVISPLGSGGEILMVAGEHGPCFFNTDPFATQIPAEWTAGTTRKPMDNVISLGGWIRKFHFGDLRLLDELKAGVSCGNHGLKIPQVAIFERDVMGFGGKLENRLKDQAVEALDIDLAVIGNAESPEEIFRWRGLDLGLDHGVSTRGDVPVEGAPLGDVIVDIKGQLSAHRCHADVADGQALVRDEAAKPRHTERGQGRIGIDGHNPETLLEMVVLVDWY